MARGRRKLEPLLPVRSSEPDLFICDILDATPKGDRASMEHPLFSLSIKKDMAPFEYERGNAKLSITPSHDEGRANIFDRDILIYVLSQLMEAKNQGQPIGRKVRLCAHDLLKATNRHTTGPAYATLKRALTRLQFTKIETNIHDSGLAEWRQISFITEARIVREDATGRMLDVEIEIGEWLLKAVQNDNVLTLSRDYFRLRKPLERRLYELARKHCGQQREWRIGLDALKQKCGSTSTEKEFKRLIKAICRTDAKEDHMPDYCFELEADILLVRPKLAFTEAIEGPSPTLPMLLISGEGRLEAKQHAGGWDIDFIEQEFRDWVASRKEPSPIRSVDAAFIGFTKTWVKRRGQAA